MTKTGKRILTVIILILTVLLVGCLLYTGNRLANYPNTFNDYKRAIYDGKDDTMVVFTDDGAWYGTENSEVILLEFVDYSDGVITMKKNDKIYRFVAVETDTLYDETSKNFLMRRVSNDEFT